MYLAFILTKTPGNRAQNSADAHRISADLSTQLDPICQESLYKLDPTPYGGLPNSNIRSKSRTACRGRTSHQIGFYISDSLISEEIGTLESLVLMH